MNALSALLLTFATPLQEEASSSPYLEAAVRAGHWLADHAIETDRGAAWLAVPAEAHKEPSTSLYSGTSGIVLFLFELLRATGDEEAWGWLARAGAAELLHRVPEEIDGDGAGLWTGVGGVGFVLHEVFRATGDERYRAGAIRCAELIHGAAEETEHGVRWNATTDVISGAAGTGFFLLYMADAFERPDDLALAARAGRQLIAVADETEHGLDWAISPDFPRRMPNFSHGTAGVAAFLAALHVRTGDAAFLAAAKKGASHLRAIADPDAEGFRVHHHTPGGEDLYYLGWCHGPVGTARLFEALAASGEADVWTALESRCSATVRTAALDANRTPGFWNNVGICCGSSGIAQHFLERYRESSDADDLAYARALADDVIARATKTSEGWSWIQAEHRVRPEILQAQTGYMQGAAGIGLMLLELDAALAGREGGLRLPDDPF